MFFNVLGIWLRDLFSIVLLIAAVLVTKEWFDELPRQAAVTDPVTGIAGGSSTHDPG